MAIADALLAEFEQESQTTKRFLERLSEKDLHWKPHDKSLTAGQLALHIAKLPSGIIQMAQQDKCPPPSGMGKPSATPQSLSEIFDAFENSLEAVKRVMPTFDDKQMADTWALVVDGQPLFSTPRVGLLRTLLLNHLYHHRGQFGVYLRLLGAKVPSSYGPSGDEVPEWMAAMFS